MEVAAALAGTVRIVVLVAVDVTTAHITNLSTMSDAILVYLQML